MLNEAPVIVQLLTVLQATLTEPVPRANKRARLERFGDTLRSATIILTNV